MERAWSSTGEPAHRCQPFILADGLSRRPIAASAARCPGGSLEAIQQSRADIRHGKVRRDLPPWPLLPRPTSWTNNGRCWRHCCHLPTGVAGPALMIAARSTGSYGSSARVLAGLTCQGGLSGVRPCRRHHRLPAPGNYAMKSRLLSPDRPEAHDPAHGAAGQREDHAGGRSLTGPGLALSWSPVDPALTGRNAGSYPSVVHH
jgi:hypothetical protein